MKNQIDELELENLELQNQTLELESLIAKFTNRVNITEFSVWGFTPCVGVTISSHVNVTIQNLGINNVEGLTLRIVVQGDEHLGKTFQINNLQVGQKHNIKTDVFWSLDWSGASVATLMLDDLILDEYRLHVNLINSFSYARTVSITIRSLGFHSFFSFLRNLANKRASSLIKVSRVCLLPCFILGISTLRLKREINPSAKLPVSYSQRCVLLPIF